MANAVALLPDGTELPLSTTFGDVPRGAPVAYLGSEAMLEIAINGGSAADHFKLTVDDPITLTFRG
jgi:S-adenosylmethionine hydrolase